MAMPDENSLVKVRRRRATKPKVRTGCSTCKRRRVKCDEKKPSCNECQRSGWDCEGYAVVIVPWKKKQKPAKPEPRVLHPLVPVHSPSTQQFQSQEEYHSFRYFCDETADQLSGLFDTSFWKCIVPQACQEHEFILHGVITIGSLSRSVTTDVEGRPQAVMPPRILPDNIAELALKSYSNFLSGSSKMFLEGTKGRRIALVVCLLITCIESIHWRHVSAWKHLRHGIQILDEWVKTTPRGPQTLPLSSPQPAVIEEEIVQQFQTLELETNLIFEPRCAEADGRIRREGRSRLSLMPPLFHDVHEARFYLEVILRRAYRQAGLDCIERTLEFLTHEARDNQLAREYLTRPAGESEGFDRQLYMTEIYSWTKAFEPLYQRILPASQGFLPARILKSKSVIVSIIIAGNLTDSQLIYDSFLTQFREFIDLTTSIFNHPDVNLVIPQGIICAETGIMTPLFFTATRCRDHDIRHEALALLKSRSWREGGKWSVPMANMAEWLISVEEESLEGGIIPEYARCCFLAAEMAASHGVTVKLIQGVGIDAVVRESRLRKWAWAKDIRDYLPSEKTVIYRPVL